MRQAALSRFTAAFKALLFDEDCASKGRPVQFFCDTAVIVPMVLGYGQFITERTPPSMRTLTAQALFSSNYLGNVFILRPHVQELEELIRAMDCGRIVSDEPALRDARSIFLARYGLRGKVESLLQRLQGEEEDSVKTQAVIEALIGVGAPAFVAIELSQQPWQQRLVRLWGEVLVVEDLPIELGSVLRSSYINQFKHALYERRPDKRREMNNLRDAVALTLLHLSVAKGMSDDTMPLVRFYTVSSAIIKSLRARPELRGLLTYTRPGADMSGRFEGPEFILRNDDYFILKAMLRSLVEPEKGAQPSASATIDVSAMKAFSQELDEAIQKNAQDRVLATVDSWKLGGRRFGALLQEFEDASLLQTTLKHDRVPQFLSGVFGALPSKSDVLAGVQRQLDNIRGELDHKLRFLHRWSHAVREIAAYAGPWARHLKEHPDPMRDLGLGRWSNQISEKGIQAVHDYVTQLLSGPEDQVLTVCSHLAGLCEECPREEDALAASAVLWMMLAFKHVVNVIDAHQRGLGSDLPDHLRLMRAAAYVRARPWLSQQEKMQVIDELEQGARQPGDGQAHRLFGVGYVAYHCWFNEGTRHHRTVQERPPDREQVQGQWAYRSFESTLEALSLFEQTAKNSLSWAFALNHAVYVAASAGIYPDQLPALREQLNDLRIHPTLWHYRFADTLAYDRYQRARHEYETLIAQPNESSKRRACVLVKQALEFLAEATPSFNDPDIRKHKVEVEELSFKIDCDGTEIAEATSR